jgi:hypothetical protein
MKKRTGLFAAVTLVAVLTAGCVTAPAVETLPGGVDELNVAPAAGGVNASAASDIPVIAPNAAASAGFTLLSAYADGCPDEAVPDLSAHPANSAYPDPEVSASCVGGNLVIESNGIPNFEFVQVTPNRLQAQDYTFTIPLNPTLAAQPTGIDPVTDQFVSVVGVTITGLPFFSPYEAPFDGYGDAYLDGLLDYCEGHTAQRGDYHFHARPDCIIQGQDGVPYLILGWALDGFPILSPYICDDPSCSVVSEVYPSWQLTNPSARAAYEKHSYVAESGDLDECNGMTLSDGSYAYFATDSFPYVVGCFNGNVTLQGGGGGAQAPAGGDTGGQPQPPVGAQPGGQQGGGGGRPAGPRP